MSAAQISLALYDYLCQHIVGTEKTVKTKRLLNMVRDNTSKGENYTVITSGSFGEGLELSGSDIDIMFVLKRVNVSENIKQINFDRGEATFVMDTENTKQGFTKLRLINDNEKNNFIELCTRIGSAFYLSNGLFKSNFISKVTNSFHGPCVSDDKGRLDLAYCLHSRSWISTVAQWLKRSHTSWPSSDVKTKIVDHGVLFVPIGAKGSENEDLEWRESFSIAEKLLVYSFNHTQVLCYALMKILLTVIKKEGRCKDLLCSYYIKTVIFWISEELPLTVWKPKNLVICFLRCFRRLIYHVKYSICPHFFIPQNNLFENRIEGCERELLLKHLYLLYSCGWRCVLLSEELQRFSLIKDATNNNFQTFPDYNEQILHSKVTILTFPPRSHKKAFHLMHSYKSSTIKLFYLFYMSTSYNEEAQNLPVNDSNGNKDIYKQHRKCLCYLLQNIYHDAVVGWLMMASFFYENGQYNEALHILSYALSKCTLDKIFCPTKLSNALYRLLMLKTWQRAGLIRFLKIQRVLHMCFRMNSSLIPRELEQEVIDDTHFVPPVVFAHFLCFLCHYHLNNLRQCRNAIRDLELTIREEYFILDNEDKAVSYNCLGIAFQLIGEYKAGTRALKMAIELDTNYNPAVQRWIKTNYLHQFYQK